MQGTEHRHAQRTPIARPTDRSRGGGAERENVCACAAHRVPHQVADIRVQRRFASHLWLGARHMPDIFEEIKAAEARAWENLTGGAPLRFGYSSSLPVSVKAIALLPPACRVALRTRFAFAAFALASLAARRSASVLPSDLARTTSGISRTLINECRRGAGEFGIAGQLPVLFDRHGTNPANFEGLLQVEIPAHGTDGQCTTCHSSDHPPDIARLIALPRTRRREKP